MHRRHLNGRRPGRFRRRPAGRATVDLAIGSRSGDGGRRSGSIAAGCSDGSYLGASNDSRRDGARLTLIHRRREIIPVSRSDRVSA